jgi:hypothetical protein
MKSLHTISAKPISSFSSLIRGGRSVPNPKAFLQLDFEKIKNPQPILSVFRLTKEVTRTTLFPLFANTGHRIACPEVRDECTPQNRTVFPPALIGNTNGASQGMSVWGSMPSNGTHLHTFLPLPFLFESRVYETVDSTSSREELSFDVDYFCMNRNARHPRRANHGKRPCSRQHRRARRRRFGNPRR